ncbi:hypothetical protein [Methylibium sp.]|nr:hypothetical protein [Methylibium sp.]
MGALIAAAFAPGRWFAMKTSQIPRWRKKSKTSAESNGETPASKMPR